MEPITVRKAVEADLATLFQFEQGIITTERPFDPTLKDGHINYYGLEKMLSTANVHVVVAEACNEIVGSGYARIEDSKPYLKHQKHAYLGFMFVRPDYRGKGVNQKVIEALQEWAISQNITELRLDVYHDNLPAIKAYEKIGFKKLLVEMRMQIPTKKL
jgi:ribosomal protein S18 acetylase RimI-like enzyme